MAEWMIPTAVPVDDGGNPDIPELGGRAPTHNEAFLISGGVVTTGSTNVKEFWWNWENARLFVRFLSGDLGYYEDVPLDVAVEFIETMSPGRFVHYQLKTTYNWHKLERGPRKGDKGWRARPKAQVVGLYGPQRKKANRGKPRSNPWS